MRTVILVLAGLLALTLGLFSAARANYHADIEVQVTGRIVASRSGAALAGATVTITRAPGRLRTADEVDADGGYLRSGSLSVHGDADGTFSLHYKTIFCGTSSILQNWVAPHSGLGPGRCITKIRVMHPDYVKLDVPLTDGSWVVKRRAGGAYPREVGSLDLGTLRLRRLGE